MVRWDPADEARLGGASQEVIDAFWHFVLLHEIFHYFADYRKDPEPWEVYSIGPVVNMVNQVRALLGYPTRERYNAIGNQLLQLPFDVNGKTQWLTYPMGFTLH